MLILTEWKDVEYLEWESIFFNMRKPAWIFDTRVILNKSNLINIGFNVWSLGS